MDREKEIKRLMYLKCEIIRQQKKELKKLKKELILINQEKGNKKNGKIKR